MSTTMNLTKEQETAMAYLLHTLKRDSILTQLHGCCKPENFEPDKYKKMERLIDNLMLGSDDAKDYYRIATLILKCKYSDADPMFNEICAIEALYQMGIEEGKRIERAKKKATNCN